MQSSKEHQLGPDNVWVFAVLVSFMISLLLLAAIVLIVSSTREDFAGNDIIENIPVTSPRGNPDDATAPGYAGIPSDGTSSFAGDTLSLSPWTMSNQNTDAPFLKRVD